MSIFTKMINANKKFEDVKEMKNISELTMLPFKMK